MLWGFAGGRQHEGEKSRCWILLARPGVAISTFGPRFFGRYIGRASRDLDTKLSQPYGPGHSRRDATIAVLGTWGTFDDCLPPCSSPRVAHGRPPGGPRARVARHLFRG